MDDLPDQIAAPAAWVAALLASKAELERGDIVAMEPVLERMRASIARMEAKQAQGSDRDA